jgi:hypothetical protein
VIVPSDISVILKMGFWRRRQDRVLHECQRGPSKQCFKPSSAGKTSTAQRRNFIATQSSARRIPQPQNSQITGRPVIRFGASTSAHQAADAELSIAQSELVAVDISGSG